MTKADHFEGLLKGYHADERLVDFLTAIATVDMAVMMIVHENSTLLIFSDGSSYTLG